MLKKTIGDLTAQEDESGRRKAKRAVARLIEELHAFRAIVQDDPVLARTCTPRVKRALQTATTLQSRVPTCDAYGAQEIEGECINVYQSVRKACLAEAFRCFSEAVDKGSSLDPAQTALDEKKLDSWVLLVRLLAVTAFLFCVCGGPLSCMASTTHNPSLAILPNLLPGWICYGIPAVIGFLAVRHVMLNRSQSRVGKVRGGHFNTAEHYQAIELRIEAHPESLL